MMGLKSSLETVKSPIFLIPVTEPMVSSPSNLSIVGNTFDLYKRAFFQFAEQLRELIVAGKHLYCDRIGKVCHCEHNDRLFNSDLSCIEVDDLAVDRNFSHLCHDLIQCDRIIDKAPAVDQGRIISLFDRTVEIFLFKFASSSRFSAARASGSAASRVMLR